MAVEPGGFSAGAREGHGAVRMIARHGPVDGGQPVLGDLAVAGAQDLKIAPRAEAGGDDVLGRLAQPVHEVVLGEHDVAPLIVPPADDDVGVRMAGIVVVGGDPVEPASGVALHPRHELPDDGLQIAQGDTVFGRDNDPELMTVVFAPREEGSGVGLVTLAVIELAPLPAALDAVALEIAQMGAEEAGAGPARPGDVHFHDHPAHALAREMGGGPASGARRAARPGPRAGEGRAAACDQDGSAGQIGGFQDPAEIGPRAARRPGPHPPDPRLEILVLRHDRSFRGRSWRRSARREIGAMENHCAPTPCAFDGAIAERMAPCPRQRKRRADNDLWRRSGRKGAISSILPSRPRPHRCPPLPSPVGHPGRRRRADAAVRDVCRNRHSSVANHAANAASS